MIEICLMFNYLYIKTKCCQLELLVENDVERDVCHFRKQTSTSQVGDGRDHPCLVDTQHARKVKS